MSSDPYTRASLITALPKCERERGHQAAALIAHGAAAHRQRVRGHARRVLRIAAPVAADHQRVRIVDDVIHSHERRSGVRGAIVAHRALERRHTLRAHEREKARDRVGGDAEPAERCGIRAQERCEIVAAPPSLRRCKEEELVVHDRPAESAAELVLRARAAERAVARLSPFERSIAQRVAERSGRRVRATFRGRRHLAAAELAARDVVRIGDDARRARRHPAEWSLRRTSDRRA